MSKVQLIRIPLRLGEDAFTAGIISAEKEKKLIRLMKAYKQLMKIYDVVVIAPVPRPLCVMPGTVKLSSGK